MDVSFVSVGAGNFASGDTAVVSGGMRARKNESSMASCTLRYWPLRTRDIVSPNPVFIARYGQLLTSLFAGNANDASGTFAVISGGMGALMYISCYWSCGHILRLHGSRVDCSENLELFIIKLSVTSNCRCFQQCERINDFNLRRYGMEHLWAKPTLSVCQSLWLRICAMLPIVEIVEYRSGCIRNVLSQLPVICYLPCSIIQVKIVLSASLALLEQEVLLSLRSRWCNLRIHKPPWQSLFQFQCSKNHCTLQIQTYNQRLFFDRSQARRYQPEGCLCVACTSPRRQSEKCCDMKHSSREPAPDSLHIDMESTINPFLRSNLQQIQ